MVMAKATQQELISLSEGNPRMQRASLLLYWLSTRSPGGCSNVAYGQGESQYTGASYGVRVPQHSSGVRVPQHSSGVRVPQ